MPSNCVLRKQQRDPQIRLSSIMLLAEARALRDAVPAGMRLLGLDVGSKTIGLALRDGRVIAPPQRRCRAGPASSGRSKLLIILYFIPRSEASRRMRSE